MDNVKVNFKGSPVTLVGTHLQTGDKAPRFTVLDGETCNRYPCRSTKTKTSS